MKSKSIFVLSILMILGIILSVSGCQDFLIQRNANATININLDLSKLIKTARNQSTDVTEYRLKVAVYDAELYQPNSDIEKLPLITQAKNDVDTSTGSVQVSLEVPIDAKVIFVGKLYELIDDTEAKNPLYVGKSEVITVKPKDNKVHLVLSKTIADIGLDVDIEDIYIVQFNTMGGTFIESQKIQEGKTTTEPTRPTKDDFDFVGWYTSKDGGKTLESKFDFSSPIISDITLYAKWKLSEIFVFVQGATIQDGIKGEGYTESEIFKEGTNVSIPNFYMSDHEVTQGEYKAIMGTWPDESVINVQQVGIGDNFPAHHVSWFDALVYCNKRSIAEKLTPCYSINESTDPKNWDKVPDSEDHSNYQTWLTVTCDFQANGYRLPTEAEWEYAARGGNGLTGFQYQYSGSNTIDSVAWYSRNSDETSHEVKKKVPNRLDVYDMSGNLWEWCWDYAVDSLPNHRRNRGGNWENDAIGCELSYRNDYYSYERVNTIGFRVVRTATEQSQGDVYSQGISLNGKIYDKTSEVVVVPSGTVARIAMTDDSSWNTYYEGEDASLKGVFLNGRNVQLSPFAMSQFEVTQELWEAIFNWNPSKFQGSENPPADGEIQNLRPVECITWYDAVNFCNELTKRTMGEEHCVYKIENASYPNDYVEYADVSIDLSKKGYRLPTEAEWEFAARGGDPTKEEWKYAYAGVQTNIAKDSFWNYPDSTSLEEFGWYGCNSDSKTHEVGKKYPNTLGLFDMNGNVYEWCYDWHSDEIDTTFVNPLGANSGEKRSARGGCLTSQHKWASVGYRYTMTPGLNTQYGIGFRLVRTLK